MGTYGFHSLHGRALPIAEGVKIRRPDLNVFVNMGDGDCCSIGTGHWIHAMRYNMNMVVIVHDNEIYGMTKKQVSPTTPVGTKTNTSPTGSVLNPISILGTTLSMTNVSFVANAVEWIPEVLFNVIKQAFHHRGLSFIRVIQRCPHYLPNFFDRLVNNPENLQMLTHENGLQFSDAVAKIYKNQLEHDPSDINRARELAAQTDVAPVGILFRNENIPCLEDLKKAPRVVTLEMRKKVLEREFDRFAVQAG
jgi:2-oxoglutarate ferredoxin oxidoreductase subunit beta